MSEENITTPEEESEMDRYYRQSRRQIIPRPTTPLGRLGCGVVLVIWFLLLLLPFAMFWLGSGSTITIPQGNVPDHADHPLLEIRLIMDADNRGLQVKQSGVTQRDEQNLCLEERVSYLLWESDTNSENALYCQCYERASEDAEWSLRGTTNGSCEG